MIENVNALMSPSEVAALLGSEKVVLIDTRDPSEYTASHLPGAVNIHEIFSHFVLSGSRCTVFPLQPFLVYLMNTVLFVIFTGC